MSPSPTVRVATPADREVWLRLRCELWPEDVGGHAAEVDAHFHAPDEQWPSEVLLADVDGEVVGFAEASIRPHAEGCETRHVGYLEGWFVGEAHRRSGVGQALVTAVEEWARARGCSELASDTEPENVRSFHAHLACGFEDAGLVRCFRKRL